MTISTNIRIQTSVKTDIHKVHTSINDKDETDKWKKLSDIQRCKQTARCREIIMLPVLTAIPSYILVFKS